MRMMDGLDDPQIGKALPGAMLHYLHDIGLIGTKEARLAERWLSVQGRKVPLLFQERPYEASLFPGIGFGLFLRSLGGGRRRPPSGGARAIKPPVAQPRQRWFLCPCGDGAKEALRIQEKVTARRAGVADNHVHKSAIGLSSESSGIVCCAWSKCVSGALEAIKHTSLVINSTAKEEGDVDGVSMPAPDSLAVLEPSTCGSTLTLAKVGDSTARGMGWMSLASLQKGAVLLSIPQGRRNGIHAERREWNTCNEPERSKSNQKALTFGIECAGDKCQSKCTEEALRYLSSLNIKSFRSAKEKEKANDGFEPLTAKASRSKPPLSTKNRYNEKHRLLDHNTTPSAPEIELARYQAEDLLRSRKVDIIHQMAGLDPTGDWMGKGARALDRLSHYQGANSFRTQLTASIDKAERPWLSIIAHRASALLQRFANPKRLAMRIQLR
ncbi:hypothetical protein Ahy_B10g104181 [Arachis hypogaea]|uniref:DUF8018 domain-containing protein n=1 Tax=Arachis hypogaea TaxID=3818 RepID=A0A444X544_ARAHY|nr:hypothetical protein Ahy_B10g104181 [Arachis hypogaea]